MTNWLRNSNIFEIIIIKRNICASEYASLYVMSFVE